MGNRNSGNGSHALQSARECPRSWLVVFISLVSFLTACADFRGASAMDAGQVKQVQGQTWLLETLRVDGDEHSLPPQSQATLQLRDDGNANGVAFVNSFFGEAAVGSHGALMWGDAFGATKMAGPPELMELEQLYLSALPKTSRMRLEAEQMILESADETTRLQFRPLDESKQ